jgi:hypothetical protein
VLITRALIARRAPNRVIDETESRIRDAFQLGHSTILRTRILNLHDCQIANLLTRILTKLNALQHSERRNEKARDVDHKVCVFFESGLSFIFNSTYKVSFTKWIP